MGVAVHNRPKVGVVIQKWAWPLKFRACFARINFIMFSTVLCPGFSSYKLGNYAMSFLGGGGGTGENLKIKTLTPCFKKVFFSLRGIFFPCISPMVLEK